MLSHTHKWQADFQFQKRRAESCLPPALNHGAWIGDPARPSSRIGPLSRIFLGYFGAFFLGGDISCRGGSHPRREPSYRECQPGSERGK